MTFMHQSSELPCPPWGQGTMTILTCLIAMPRYTVKSEMFFPSICEYVASRKIKFSLMKNYYIVCLFVCSGLTSLSTLSVISRPCLVVTGSSMLTFIVLPHCGIRSQTLLPDTTPSHIILTLERPVLALPR